MAASPPPLPDDIGATVLSIYRARNVARVEKLVDASRSITEDIRLWVFDEVVPALAERTVGCGPGGKFALLNRLVESADVRDENYLAVLDDDIEFVRGDLRALVACSRAAGLDLTQPAHARASHHSHAITVRRPFSRARLTTFVEIGPLFVLSPTARPLTVPFPENLGMGWGLELQWVALREEGLTLGIVDSVAVRHLTPVEDSYDSGPERERMREMLDAMGLRSIRDVHATLATWRVWQREPPWRQVG